jgi:20S proteasome alpha/beta subunit
MTTIAWDGKTLAADKRAVNNGYSGGTVTKIHHWTGGLCAFSGDLDVGMQMVQWLRDGANPAKYPAQQEKNACVFLVIMRDGRTCRYESTPVALWFENEQQAMGSGRDYALAAMHLGKTAREAVEVAIALDCGSGNGIDTLTPESWV